MDGAILWFVNKEHWLIVIGITFAVLGAFYNAYGLDQQHKFFGGLTQGLLFGLLGGGFVGLGLGVSSSFLILIAIVLTHMMNDQSVGLTISSGLIFIGAFSLIGIILGIIFGFLVGFQLDMLQKSIKRSKFLIVLTLIAFLLMFILSSILDILFVSFQQVLTLPTILFGFIDVPLLGGCISGFVFGPQKSVFEYLQKRYWKTTMLLFNIFLFSIFVFATINEFSTIPLLSSTIYSLLEFVYGFLIGSELNMPYSSKKKQKKPSWLIFIFWSLLGEIGGIVLAIVSLHYYLYFLPYLQNLLTVSGILIGIRRGKIAELLHQPKIKVKLSSMRNQLGLQNQYVQVDISWPRFIRGFWVGFIVFASYVSQAPFPPTNLASIYYLFASGLIGAIPVGFMIGCLYGIGPFILFKVTRMSDYRLGQIGVFLTVLGIVLLAIPSLSL